MTYIKDPTADQLQTFIEPLDLESSRFHRAAQVVAHQMCPFSARAAAYFRFTTDQKALSLVYELDTDQNTKLTVQITFWTLLNSKLLNSSQPFTVEIGRVWTQTNPESKLGSNPVQELKSDQWWASLYDSDSGSALSLADRVVDIAKTLLQAPDLL